MSGAPRGKLVSEEKDQRPISPRTATILGMVAAVLGDMNLPRGMGQVCPRCKAGQPTRFPCAFCPCKNDKRS